MKKLLAVLATSAAVVLAACGSTSGTSSNGTDAKPVASKQGCSPTPCSSKDGVTVNVSNVVYGAQPGEFEQPQPGTVYVTMQIAVKNDGSSEYHLNPTSFVLKDATGVKHQYTPMISNQATTWQPVNLTKGASQTETLSFQAAADHPQGLWLVWTPTLFSGDQNIKLS
ncbi:MAG TPA: DUF4352 domain-containing protein [Candidatus Binatia bacterium]|nr:DUF4352 domain-containing protein [Candidatus Binatia bacterium]